MVYFMLHCLTLFTVTVFTVWTATTEDREKWNEAAPAACCWWNHVRVFFSACGFSAPPSTRWTHQEWPRAYSTDTDNTSIASSNQYLHFDIDQSNSEYTHPKTVTFDYQQTTPKTVANISTPNYSQVRRPEGNTALAASQSTAYRALPSPPHTLHSDNATQSSQSQFDFRSTNDSRRDDERGNYRTIHLSI